MLIFYAAADGIGKDAYRRERERELILSKPILLTYYNIGVDARQRWIWKLRRKRKK